MRKLGAPQPTRPNRKMEITANDKRRIRHPKLELTLRTRRESYAMAYHVSKAEFMELVDSAVSDLPEEFARFLEEVPIEVHDLPSPSQRARLRSEGGMLLLGLYVGRPRTQRSVEDSGAMPDVI